MLKALGWVVGIALFLWAIFGTFSLLSRLGFLVDSLSWSANHAPLTVKTIALEIGKWISQIVTGYREFVRGIARLLHLPQLSSFGYDVLGIAAFSVGRGGWLRKRDSDKHDEEALRLFAWRVQQARRKVQLSEEEERSYDRRQIENDARFPLHTLSRRVVEPFLGRMVPKPIEIAERDFDGQTESIALWIIRHLPQIMFLLLIIVLGNLIRLISDFLVYSGAVALFISALFGIDYLYRHFA